MRLHFVTQHLGKTDHRGFRGCIGAVTDEPEEADHRGHVDDVAAATGDEIPQYISRGDHGTQVVDAYRRLVGSQRIVLDIAWLCRAGAVEQKVGQPAGRFEAGHRRGHPGFVGYIGLQHADCTR